MEFYLHLKKPLGIGHTEKGLNDLIKIQIVQEKKR